MYYLLLLQLQRYEYMHGFVIANNINKGISFI